MPADALRPTSFLPLTHLSYHILLVLAGTELHGYAIIREIARRAGERMKPETGTLYTAIRRLRDEGLLEPARGGSRPADRRRGDSYRLTPLGHEVVRAETVRLVRLVEIAREKRLLGPDPATGRGRPPPPS